MNRVYIKTYGCQMNERDSDAVAALLRAKGYCIVYDEFDADIILVNTCSIRDQAEQKAIGKTGQVLKRKKRNPNLIVGIMGCMAQVRGTELIDRLPDLDLLIGTQKFHQVPDHLDRLTATLQGQGPRPSTIVDLGEEKDSQNTIRTHIKTNVKVSSFVSIMQGCNMNCTYCIVPQTRGQERSRPINDIVEEVQELVSNGTKEVTLLGQIVTSYGRREIASKNKKSAFVQLIEAINDIKGIERIRFTSPHPRGFKEDLIEAFRDIPKLCEYIHLPLQSGSDRVLKLMKRPYSVARFKKIVDDLRAVVPNMHFSTDIIVGFPGETEEDFEATRKIFDELEFEMGFIFKYSPRQGTEATLMEGQVPQQIKDERNQILLSILEKHSIKKNSSYIGKTTEVLVEGPARKGDYAFVGRNRGYRKVVFPANERLVGQIVNVSINHINPSTLFGELSLAGVDAAKSL